MVFLVLTTHLLNTLNAKKMNYMQFLLMTQDRETEKLIDFVGWVSEVDPFHLSVTEQPLYGIYFVTFIFIFTL